MTNGQGHLFPGRAAPDRSPSLDLHESPSQVTEPTTLATPGARPLADLPDPCNPDRSPGELCQSFRHSCWHRQRQAVFTALVASGCGQSRLERFRECGSDVWLMRSAADRNVVRLGGNYCHDRWCLPCGLARSRLLAANMRSLISDRPHRFMTLTLKANDEGLTARLRHLYASFSRLRRNPIWKRNVTGGAAFCECIWSAASAAWHVHLHIIAAGKFLPQQQLSDAWLRSTGDSFIVDVRLIGGHDKAVDYVTKYASKPLHPETVRSHDRLCEMIVGLRSRRLVLTFGTWARCKLTATPERQEWIAVCPLHIILRDAELGSPAAQALLNSLVHRTRREELPLWQLQIQNPFPSG